VGAHTLLASCQGDGKGSGKNGGVPFAAWSLVLGALFARCGRVIRTLSAASDGRCLSHFDTFYSSWAFRLIAFMGLVGIDFLAPIW
jgi:hypothetical protein